MPEEISVDAVANVEAIVGQVYFALVIASLVVLEMAQVRERSATC